MRPPSAAQSRAVAVAPAPRGFPVVACTESIARDRRMSITYAHVNNSQTDAGDAGRVRHGQIVAGADRDLVPDLDLPPQMQQECPVRNVGDVGAGQPSQPVDDLLAVVAVAGLDRDVPDDAIPLGLDEIHGADVTTGLADRRGDAPEHARAVLDLQPDGEAIARARGN